MNVSSAKENTPHLADYEQFTAKIVNKLRGKGSVRCEEFITEVFKALSKHDLSLDAHNSIKKVVTTAYNVKTKEQQTKKKGKPKKELKMQVNVLFLTPFQWYFFCGQLPPSTLFGI